MNPRKMQHMMKQMGIAQEDIDASEVVITCPDKTIRIRNPQVAKVKMMGQETFQVSGDISEEAASSEPELSEEDIAAVMEQTGVPRDEAEQAIKDNEYDLAAAIMALKKE